MDSLLEKLNSLGLTIEPKFTGEWEREGSQFFKGITIGTNGSAVQSAIFGDWARPDCKATWQSREVNDPALQAELTEKMKEAFRLERLEQEKKWINTKEEANRMWDMGSGMGTHDYFHKKKLKGLFGCRVLINPSGFPVLLVPMQDIDGELWNITRIYSKNRTDKEGKDIGNKLLLPGGRKEALFHVLGDLSENTVYFAEGVSTAASIHEATEGRLTIVCFDAGNMPKVAQAFRSKYPEKAFIFCADNDKYKPLAGNAGIIAAQKAAKVSKGEVRLPLFKDETTHPTDFNDLHILEGLEAVKAQLAAPSTMKEPENMHQNNHENFTHSEQNEQESSKKESKSEQKKGNTSANTVTKGAGIAEKLAIKALLDEKGDNLLKQGKKDFFEYVGTHWEHLDPDLAESAFKRSFDQYYNFTQPTRVIESTYRKFNFSCPTVPANKNMFAPDTCKVSFTNGTLHLLRRSDGHYDTELRPHSREDLTIHCHPFKYDAGAGLNDEFERSVENILGHSKDQDFTSAQNAYFEVLGACLVPGNFRKLVFFIGPPKSGKSTLILFAANMVDQKFTSSVDPTKLHNFNLQSMAGKLLNFDTDINLSRPITDEVLKKVEDNTPRRIERKGFADIYAPIPGMHLFGANRMPNTDEDVNVYERRMIFFDCSNYEAPKNYVQDYAPLVWAKNPGGVIVRAIQGLGRIAASGGHFTNPQANQDMHAKWGEETGDCFTEFLSELKANDCKLADKNTTLITHAGVQQGMIERGHLYDLFVSWYASFAPRALPPNRKLFYSGMRRNGVRDVKSNGVRYFPVGSVVVPIEAKW